MSRHPGAVVTAVAALALGCGTIWLNDSVGSGVPVAPSGNPESRRPVQDWQHQAPALPLRSQAQKPRIVVVPSALRESTASYDRSHIQDVIDDLSTDEPLGPVSRRPRGFPAVTVPGVPKSTSPPVAQGATGGPVISVIEGTDFNDNQINTGGGLFVPPDTHGAAGPDHLISVTNVSMRIYDKAGGLLYDAALVDFFAGLTPRTWTFDPRVLYDQHAERWVVLTTEFTDVQFGAPSDTASLYVAVSDGPDPTGTWYQAQMNVQLSFFNPSIGFTTHHWIDFPCLGVDEDVIYIHAKAVSNFSAGGITGGYRLFVLDKGLGTGGLYDGGTLSSDVYDPYEGGAGLEVTSQPAHVFGTIGGTIGTFLVGYSGLTDGVNEFLQTVSVENPLGAIRFTPRFIALGNIEATGSALPGASQLGTSVRLDTAARRLLSAVWRDNALWSATQIAGGAGTPDAGQVSAHWVKLSALASGSVSLIDQGSISGNDIAPGTFTFYPSIAVNDRGDAVVGFSASGPSIYPSAYAALRRTGDPAGTIGPSLQIREGVAFYIRPLGGSSNRWGDYSGAAVDPEDECFWVHNQYAKTQGTIVNNQSGRWATALGRVCAFECGNGVAEAPETCDDGNAIDGDVCSNACEVNACGPVDTDNDMLGDGCDPDDDNDGTPDPQDCAPLDDEAASAPADVTELWFQPPTAKGGGGSAELTWTPQDGVRFDVATGVLSKLRSQMGTSSASCLVDDVSGAPVAAPNPIPFPGDGFYYMVRAQNACGEGSYGSSSGGTPRVPVAACP